MPLADSRGRYFLLQQEPLRFCKYRYRTVGTYTDAHNIRYTRGGVSSLIGALRTSNNGSRSVSDLRANRVVIPRQPSHKPSRQRLVATRACSLRPFPTSSILIPSNCPLPPPARALHSPPQLEGSLRFRFCSSAGLGTHGN